MAAGASSTLGPGEVRVVALPRDAASRVPREALVLRDAEGELRAYLNRCRHLPIPLDAGSRRFLTAEGAHLVCGTHGALYRLHDGYCTHGPCAGESLDPIAFELDGDAIYLIV